jgi:hypothetical protein
VRYKNPTPNPLPASEEEAINILDMIRNANLITCNSDLT